MIKCANYYGVKYGSFIFQQNCYLYLFPSSYKSKWIGIKIYSASPILFLRILVAEGVRTNCLSTVLLRVVYLGRPEYKLSNHYAKVSSILIWCPFTFPCSQRDKVEWCIPASRATSTCFILYFDRASSIWVLISFSIN